MEKEKKELHPMTEFLLYDPLGRWMLVGGCVMAIYIASPYLVRHGSKLILASRDLRGVIRL